MWSLTSLATGDHVSTNRFSPEKFYDFCIVNPKGRVVGHIRVKPSGIHWAPKDAKRWYGISIRTFGKWMEVNGTRKSK
jgi:hypothetical protein